MSEQITLEDFPSSLFRTQIIRRDRNVGRDTYFPGSVYVRFMGRNTHAGEVYLELAQVKELLKRMKSLDRDKYFSV